MTRMQTAITSLAGKDAKKAQSDMAIACNTYSLDLKAFIEVILSQKPKTKKIWTDICWYWIKRLSVAYAHDKYDDRNKQSCYIGCRLYNASEPLPDLPKDSFITIFIGEMAYAHRTIQQSYSSLVFG